MTKIRKKLLISISVQYSRFFLNKIVTYSEKRKEVKTRMPEMIQIQNSQIQVKEYRDKRVVTFKDIDTVHQRPDGTARRNFNQNRKRFISGVDFYTVKPSDFQKYEIRPAEINNNGTTLITESGYLMLVKSFTDDLAWKVQRELVDTYFRARLETVSQTVTVTETAFVENPEILIRAVEALAGCLEGNRPYVLNILRHIVPDVDIPEQETVTEVKTESKNRTYYWKQGVPIDTDKMLLTAAEQGISIEELARRSMVSTGTMTNWITGKHKPVLQNRSNVCVALGKDEDYLTPRRQRRKR